MAWLYLVIAGILEIAWAIGMKQSQGWTRLWPSVWTLVTMILSFWLLSKAMNLLPAGTAYAVWTGIGAAGTALLGILILKEPASAARIACILLIVAGVIGLKVFSKPEAASVSGGADVAPTVAVDRTTAGESNASFR